MVLFPPKKLLDDGASMRIKIAAALLGSAVISALAIPVYAQSVGGVSNAVPQPAYPFDPPKPAQPSPLDELRGGVLEENLGLLLRPDDIGAINNHKLDAQGASTYPGYAGKALPSARRRDIRYAQGPQQGPENLWLAQNIPSPVSFQDQYGNPWPIVSIAYDARYYSVNGKGCGGGSQNGGEEPTTNAGERPTFLLVTPCRFWTWGSFTVQLQGLNTPIVFVAGSGTDDQKPFVDVPVLVHVEGLSPTAKGPKAAKGKKRSKAYVARAPQVDPGPDSAYQAFLNGTPPRGAMQVGTSDPNAAAWLWQGSMYLVAPYSVVTPDYEATARGNNKNIFRFGRSTARVLASAEDGSERVISIGN